jgi:uncharacterized membrane protein
MTLTLIVVFSLLFVATHLGMSHGSIREGLVGKIGEWPFRGLYSLVSFLTLGPAAVLWWQNRHLGPVLWEIPFWTGRALAMALVLFGIELIVLSLATPSPASMVPGKIEERGILRITRHPMNIGIALWALAHVLTNGTLGDVAFFGSFLALGILGPYHQDIRKKKEKGEPYVAFCRRTSVMPFGAILRGRNRIAFDELAFPMLVIAFAFFAGLVFFHDSLFGVRLF